MYKVVFGIPSSRRTYRCAPSLTIQTGFVSQASIFEGGIRVPGIMHAPMLIRLHQNITTPTVTSDFLPTIMEILDVKTDNPSWIMDGMSLLPYIQGNTTLPRPHPIGVAWGSSSVRRCLSTVLFCKVCSIRDSKRCMHRTARTIKW